MTKCFAYLRISSSGQAAGDGYTRQADTIEAYAKKAGYQIVQTFRDEVSGTKDETERPAFQEMVTALLSNGVRVILIERLDRLARAYTIQEQLLMYLASKNLTLISASTEDDVTAAMKADPMRKATIQLFGIIAELEKNLIIRRLKVARDRIKAKTGKCGGRKSYKELAPEVLKTIKQLNKTGGYTYKGMADSMNHQGLATATGKPFTAGTVRNLLHRYA